MADETPTTVAEQIAAAEERLHAAMLAHDHALINRDPVATKQTEEDVVNFTTILNHLRMQRKV